MKDLKISKELIKNVLAKETENLSDDFIFSIKDNYILFVDEGECQFEVNIYEFAFKCKDWALKKEVMIHSSPTQKKESTAIVQSFDMSKFYYGQNQFYALTEPEAIIKACRWVLEQNK